MCFCYFLILFAAYLSMRSHLCLVLCRIFWICGFCAILLLFYGVLLAMSVPMEGYLMICINIKNSFTLWIWRKLVSVWFNLERRFLFSSVYMFSIIFLLCLYKGLYVQYKWILTWFGIEHRTLWYLVRVKTYRKRLP